MHRLCGGDEFVFMENSVALGIDLNAKAKFVDNWTGFHLACERGHANTVKIFMVNAATLKIDLNAKEKRGSTALHLACS